MDVTNPGSWVILLGLVFLQGIITATYYAIANTHKGVLRDSAEEGDRRARRTLKLGQNASALLITQQYVSLLLNTLTGAVLVRFMLPDLEAQFASLGWSDSLATAAALVVLIPVFTLLLLAVGFQIPNAVMPGRTENFAMLVSLPAGILVNGLAPILQMVQRFSQMIGKLLGGAGQAAIVTEEEIKTLVDAGSEEGIIEDEEKEMIYSVFKFGDTLAREVMVPRIDIEALDISTSLEDALDKIVRVGHSRIPVFENSIDNIRGLLYAKDLLVLWRNQEHTNKRLEDILRKPYFIPETKPAGNLLTELQERKVHLAIVIDEYGGTAGLVTIEDLIEEIVGEIRDEYDLLEEESYEEVGDNEYICLAGIDLDDLNDLLDVELPTEDNDTLGGLIFTELDAVPSVGDKVIVQNVEMKVLTLDGRRIHRVHVRKLERETDDDDPKGESLAQDQDE